MTAQAALTLLAQILFPGIAIIAATTILATWAIVAYCIAKAALGRVRAALEPAPRSPFDKQ